MSDALNALFEALYTRLVNADPLWDNRVRPEYIPGRDSRPVIVYSWSGGGDQNNFRKRDPVFTVDIKIITSSNNQNASADAMAGASAITDLIDNQGSQDMNSAGVTGLGVVTGDDDWVITTITQGMRIHIVDNWSENGVAVYHSGHEFRVTMEEL